MHVHNRRHNNILSFIIAIDECSTSADCVAGTLCINTAEGPGFLCQCPPGFTGDGRHSGSGCQGKKCNIVVIIVY